MKYVVDTHTHTTAGGHAYTTFLENVKQASEIGLKLLGTTEHGPKMPGGPHIFYFGNLGVMPRELYGVTLLHGCEANILDAEGNLDIPELIQAKLDIIIASLHDVCIAPSSREENTRAIVNAMKNPYVDIIGHAGNPVFDIDLDELVRNAKKYDKIIEINNASFTCRAACKDNCYEIARLCKKYGVKVIMNSDAHTCFHIGKFPKAELVLEEVGIEEELIMNTDEKKLINYLKAKNKLTDLL